MRAVPLWRSWPHRVRLAKWLLALVLGVIVGQLTFVVFVHSWASRPPDVSLIKLLGLGCWGWRFIGLEIFRTLPGQQNWWTIGFGLALPILVLAFAVCTWFWLAKGKWGWLAGVVLALGALTHLTLFVGLAVACGA